MRSHHSVTKACLQCEHFEREPKRRCVLCQDYHKPLLNGRGRCRVFDKAQTIRERNEIIDRGGVLATVITSTMGEYGGFDGTVGHKIARHCK